MESDAISSLLKKYPTLTLVNDGKLVRCSMTGHEMPLKPDIVQAYVGSKRYARLLSLHSSPYYQKYKQFLVDCSSKKHLQEPWPLHGDPSSQKTGTEVDPKNKSHAQGSESWKVKGAPARKSRTSAAAATNAEDDNDDDIDDILGQTHQVKPETDDGKDADDEDSYSDLYPEDDFKEMDVDDAAAESSHQESSKNPLKRHTKPKKPTALKDVKAKRHRTDDD